MGPLISDEHDAGTVYCINKHIREDTTYYGSWNGVSQAIHEMVPYRKVCAANQDMCASISVVS